MKLQNIILVNDAAHINGGAGKVAISSAIGLTKRGYHVILFSAIGPIDDNLTKNGVEVICLRQFDILTDPSRLRAIRQGIWNTKAEKEFIRLLEKYNPENTIIHFHGWTKAISPILFRVTAHTSFRVIITLHEFFTSCPNGGFFNYQRKEICERIPMSLSCLLCNCDARSYPQKVWRLFRQYIQNLFLVKNHRLAFISISQLCEDINRKNLKSFSAQWYKLNNPVELNKQSIIDINNNSSYLFIARLSYEKGADLFCQAITDLGLKGIVLGDGYQREELQIKYPNIIFTGWVDGKQKEEYIHQAKGMVLTSRWYETFGLVVTEMKSYGIPCIVPDRCAASEQIVDGKTGYIFNTGDLNSLKECLIRYEQSDPTDLQRAIISTFKYEDYTIETHIDNLLEIYNDFIQKK